MKSEVTEAQIEALFPGHEIVRPNKFGDIIEQLSSAHMLIIDPKGRGMKAASIIGHALNLGVHVVQCVPDEDPSTERTVTLFDTAKKKAA